jgi:hypothetical protein
MLQFWAELGFLKAGNTLRRDMACKACGSESLIRLDGEITASSPRVEDAKLAPIYFAQEMWVCLTCGSAEVRVPEAQLDLLNQRKRAAS